MRKKKIDYRKFKKGDIIFYFDIFSHTRIKKLSFVCVNPLDKECLIFVNASDSRDIVVLTIYEFDQKDFISRNVKDLIPFLDKWHEENKKYFLKILNKKKNIA
jgi:hypothetical protein